MPTRQRLRLWDIPDSEIDRIEKSGEVSKTLTLYSPVSGVVLKKDAVAGLAIMPGMSLYTIADLSTVWIQAQVYEHDFRFLPAEHHGDVSAERLPVTAITQAQIYQGIADCFSIATG